MARVKTKAKAKYLVLLAFLSWFALAERSQLIRCHAAEQAPASDEDVLAAMITAREKVADACLRDPALRGAWAFRWEMKEGSDPSTHIVEVSLVVEQKNSRLQVSRLTQLIANSMQPQPTIDRVFEVPLDSMVKQLQESIRTASGDRGELVSGIRYGPLPAEEFSNDILVLAPYGRTRNDNQKALIREKCEQIQKSSHWQAFERDAAVDLVIDFDELEIYSPSEECRRLNQRLQRIVDADPLCEGTWVEVAECRNAVGEIENYDVYIRLDSQKRDAQKTRTIEIVQRNLDGKHEVIFEEVPLSKLVAQVNLLMEFDPVFDSSRVSSAYFSALETPGDVQAGIVFLGRVRHADVIPSVEKTIEKCLARDPTWRSFRERVDFVILSDQLEVTTNVPELGGAAFVRGKELLQEGSSEEAEWAFITAIMEAPSRTEFRYWRVLSVVCQGRHEDAINYMRAIRRRGVSRYDYSLVMQSMERIQGSPRMELLDIELKARMPRKTK